MSKKIHLSDSGDPLLSHLVLFAMAAIAFVLAAVIGGGE